VPALAGALNPTKRIDEMKKVLLKSLKAGELFKRKPEAATVFIREHYNRADSWGPAGYCCTDWHDIGRCIQLKGTTAVYTDFEF